MEKMITAISEKVRINDELRLLISENFTSIELAKHDQILREDQISNKLYFLETGVVRSFYYYKEKEVSSWLYGEDQFFTSWYSFINQSPSFEYLETLPSAKYNISKSASVLLVFEKASTCQSTLEYLSKKVFFKCLNDYFHFVSYDEREVTPQSGRTNF